MFGTLRPSRAALNCAGRSDWQHFYCGTCQSIGDQFGLGYRALLSHDAVFLGLLVDGLQQVEAAPDRTRCPMLPVVHRPTVSPDSVAMRYAAAIQLLLADQWLADRAIDGRSFARIARPLLDRPATRARETLAALGSDLADLIGVEHRQAATERIGVTDPEQAAEPTAAALELVFERIVALPGSVTSSVTGSSGQAASSAALVRCDLDPRALLAKLGRGVGTLIYLIDALEDLQQDQRAGDFNPCLVHDYRGRPQPDRARIRDATRALERARANVTAALNALPLVRHRPVLVNILVTQLGARAQLAAASAQQLLATSGQRPRPIQTHAVARFAQAIAALVIATFTTTWSRLVQAATTGSTDTDGTETDGTDTGGTDTGGTETGGTETGEPLDIPPDLPDATTGLEPTGEGGGLGCNCLGELIQALCGGIGDACSGCGDSLGACGGCFNGCTGFCSGCGQDCGGACSSLGSGCGQCNEGCEGCNGCGNACSDCGGACNGCGNACNGCNGCNGCGNACNGCGNGCSGCGNCGNGCGGGGCGGGGGGCNC
ncbi:Glycine-rich cell wall structural protein precursor [Enhygromyxa salina]|uniref:Glycine-rich cell wall structural protein n=1 Tax=Enhygromyxa salina TaxID=215803 RepID=A0A0C2DGU5_9BACT|nr:DUF5685 family protein [Enhygromyxa salina]KIG18892.1 Glycine-rich cell wall structural protein precursor [Enhygromyxa salina]